MKIVVFGAANNIGSAIVREGLLKGHKLTAFIDKNERYDLPDNEDLTIITGDINNPVDLNKAIRKQTIVILAIKPPVGKISSYCEFATKNIIYLQKKHRVRRLIVLSTAISLGSFNRYPKFYRYLYKFIMYSLRERWGIKDIFKQEKIIKELDYANWTLVRYAWPFKQDKRKRYYSGTRDLPSIFKTISIDDIAHFSIKAVEEDLFIKACPYIYYE